MTGWAAEYIGMRFAPNGRGPHYDCYGLVWAVLSEQFGLAVPRLDGDYETVRDDCIPVLCTREAQSWQPIAPGEEEPGDVVLFRMTERRRHVGIVTAPGYMLHIGRGLDACIERYNGPKWRHRIIGIYRWKK